MGKKKNSTMDCNDLAGLSSQKFRNYQMLLFWSKGLLNFHTLLYNLAIKLSLGTLAQEIHLIKKVFFEMTEVQNDYKLSYNDYQTGDGS